tara:strand:- start:39 stop:608 length:570 start_codon:yes stop_codon:yes gene_type:complete
MKNTALLIIDMQNDFVLEGAPMQVQGGLGIIDNVKRVLQLFREKQFPVVHVIRSHDASGDDVEITRKDIFSKTPFTVPGTSGIEVVDALQPLPGEKVIEKKRMSGFFDTALDSMLRSLGVEAVVVVGVQTPNCVRATAFDAVAYNYETYLVEDATAAQTPEVHSSNVLDMKDIGINVITVTDVEELLGS